MIARGLQGISVVLYWRFGFSQRAHFLVCAVVIPVVDFDLGGAECKRFFPSANVEHEGIWLGTERRNEHVKALPHTVLGPRDLQQIGIS
jgi:hypothetical protein